MKDIFKKALRLARTPIIISFILTPIRFLLELAGLPEAAIFIIGLLWLTLFFAVFWAFKLKDEVRPYLLLFFSLVIYSPISRFTVFIAWWVDLKWEIGTHYGLYFESWPKAFLNQVGYGTLVQLIPGFVLGALTLAILRQRQSKKEHTIHREP